MYRVLVIDTNKRALMPTHPARARQLLRDKKAAVYIRYPFTIILKREVNEASAIQDVDLKIDPGSKTTGLALVDKVKNKVLLGINLIHRGLQIKSSLDSRRANRRRRRSNLRYREPRFSNRVKSKPKGWFPPSILSRVDNIKNWYLKLLRLIPISRILIEDVKFDIQKLMNNNISGIDYQQGELYQYEVREYLLDKFNRTCAYCNIKNVQLQIDHVIPRSKGGTNRISNLVISCPTCNLRKSNSDLDIFLKNKPNILKKIKSQLKSPVKDASHTNITRNKIPDVLESISNTSIHRYNGALTKFNRTNRSYPKDHWIDASQVGYSSYILKDCYLEVEATGRGSRQMCRVDKYGFPRTSAKKNKRVHGFQTGDIVKAIVTNGKHIGKYIGRVSIRSSGSFNIKDINLNRTIQGISWQYCKTISQMNGYNFKLSSTV